MTWTSEQHIQATTFEMEKVGDEQKPVLYFEDKEKGMVLNVTNSSTLEMAYGPETDDWKGCDVILYTAKVQYGGKSVDGLRIETPQQVGITDDDVPF